MRRCRIAARDARQIMFALVSVSDALQVLGHCESTERQQEREIFLGSSTQMDRRFHE